MPYIDVNDVYILDNTGKQVDDAVDYALYNSNQNLLVNSYFVGGGSQNGYGIFPVNQRGVTTLIHGSLGIDRWFAEFTGAATITVGTNGLVYTANGGTCDIYQRIPDALLQWMAGKPFTASVLLSNGDVISGTKVCSSVGTLTSFTSGIGVDMFISAGKNFNCRSGNNITIQAVKLEYGTYSTIKNDSRPNFDAELRKCMGDFQRIALGTGYTSVIGFGVMQNSANNVRVTIPTSVPFNDGTLTASSTNLGQILLIGNSQSLTATAVTARTKVKTGGVSVDVTVSGSATSGQVYLLQLYSASAYIDIGTGI